MRLPSQASKGFPPALHSCLDFFSLPFLSFPFSSLPFPSFSFPLLPSLSHVQAKLAGSVEQGRCPLSPVAGDVVGRREADK